MEAVPRKIEETTCQVALFLQKGGERVPSTERGPPLLHCLFFQKADAHSSPRDDPLLLLPPPHLDTHRFQLLLTTSCFLSGKKVPEVGN